MKLHDVVQLTEDIPELHLKTGDKGTIVYVYGPNDFEVEFSQVIDSTTNQPVNHGCTWVSGSKLELANS